MISEAPCRSASVIIWLANRTMAESFSSTSRTERSSVTFRSTSLTRSPRIFAMAPTLQGRCAIMRNCSISDRSATACRMIHPGNTRLISDSCSTSCGLRMITESTLPSRVSGTHPQLRPLIHIDAGNRTLFDVKIRRPTQTIALRLHWLCRLGSPPIHPSIHRSSRRSPVA